jgi:hypothetical protein
VFFSANAMSVVSRRTSISAWFLTLSTEAAKRSSRKNFAMPARCKHFERPSGVKDSSGTSSVLAASSVIIFTPSLLRERLRERVHVRLLARGRGRASAARNGQRLATYEWVRGRPGIIVDANKEGKI